jgi:phosphopantetheinyl transferase
MKIFSFEELKNKSINELPHLGDLTYFLLDSTTVSSQALKQYLSNLVGNVSGTFNKGPDGKPSFTDSTYHFNLSHSGGYTALALHPILEVGIDIESWKNKSRMVPIVERYYLEAEKASLASLDDSAWETQALSIWTIKEAITKLKGGTIFQGLGSINATPTPKEIIFQCSEYGRYYLSIGSLK